MKASICTFVILFAAASVFATAEDIKKKAEEAALKIAQQQGAVKKKLTRADLENRPAILRKTGGFLDVAPVGVSVIVIDARKKTGAAADRFAEVFGNLSKTNVKIKKRLLSNGESPYMAACTELNSVKAAFAIIITESDDLPGLSIMPEDRVAVINANRYKGGDDPLATETRLIKELWRSLGFVTGTGYAPFKNDVLQPVFNLKSLDALLYQVMQPMNFQKMYSQMAEFGVKRARHIPYKLAVMEGWAPAPTNEYQRAVFNQVKADKERGPTNPIEIPMPKKK